MIVDNNKKEKCTKKIYRIIEKSAAVGHNNVTYQITDLAEKQVESIATQLRLDGYRVTVSKNTYGYYIYIRWMDKE